MREGELRELVDVGHMLGALGERDDVAARHLGAIAFLDGADGAERVEHLARHGGELAVDAVLANVGERTGVHHGVLTEFHFHHVEAEGLGLPDEGLDRSVCGANGAGLGERTLDHTQVGEEIVAGAVHRVGIAGHGGVQARCHHEHHGTMGLGVGRSLARSVRTSLIST